MRQTTRHYRRQRPISGTRRIPTLGCLDPKLRFWVEQEAKHFRVTPSFVLNTLVSHVSRIPLVWEGYRDRDAKQRHHLLKMVNSGGRL